MVPAYEQRVQEIRNELLELATEQKIWNPERIFKGDKSTSAGLVFYVKHLKKQGAKFKDLIAKQIKISNEILAVSNKSQEEIIALRENIKNLHFGATA